jgi:hypothetical protein
MLSPLAKKINKSNLVIAVLLFFFGTVKGEVGDTLILDGEVVEIEPNIHYVDIDSLEKAARNDVRFPAQPFHFYLGFSSGVIFTGSSWESADSLKSVDVYTGMKSSWRLSSTSYLQILIPVQKEFFLEAGAGYSTLKYVTNSIDPNDTISNSSRFRYEIINGNLYQYYRYPVGKGFETDTNAVPLIKNQNKAQFAEAFLGFRYFPLKLSSSVKPYIGADVLFRYRINDLENKQIALINDRGVRRDFIFLGSNFQRSMLLSRIKCGVVWEISEQWNAEAGCVFLYFPKIGVSQNDAYKVNIRQFSLGVGISRYF